MEVRSEQPQTELSPNETERTRSQSYMSISYLNHDHMVMRNNEKFWSGIFFPKDPIL